VIQEGNSFIQTLILVVLDSKVEWTRIFQEKLLLLRPSTAFPWKNPERRSLKYGFHSWGQFKTPCNKPTLRDSRLALGMISWHATAGLNFEAFLTGTLPRRLRSFALAFFELRMSALRFLWWFLPIQYREI